MSSIVHFQIPVDDVQRASAFYSKLFGWKIEKVQGMEYYGIDTYGLMGGMLKRMQPSRQITDYFGVPSIDESISKVERLGGKVVEPKTAIPGMGYYAVCMDTENNVFGLLEYDHTAK
jgi:uncharacterized protein